MAAVLKAENVSIRYITGDFKDIGVKEYVVRKLTGNYHVKEFMAVNGVSFELERGDMLGIIGSNGAGKSTLLKAIAGIMEPTHGKITSQGEIAALLELGSGFDGDLTVKENAYLRGAMLGYTKEFMDSTYDQIIDFAELREFENRPFKQLSSGMKSRLAFSIASLVKPDILILDEVLSVGDGSFQEKSAKKMKEIISQGATTILVSHSLSQIRELCNKVLWLDHGKQVAFGDTEEICDLYERFVNGEALPQISEKNKFSNSDNFASKGKNGVKKRSVGISGVICALVLGLFFGFIAYISSDHLFADTQSFERVSIVAQEGNVIYRGASINDQWYSPSDTVVRSDGWIFDENEVTYRAESQQPLEVELPIGENRTVTFNAGPDEGIVKIICNNEEIIYDLSNEEIVPLGLPYNLPNSVDDTSFDFRNLFIAIAVFVFTVILSIVFLMRDNTSKYVHERGTREVWGDLLRGFCCFIIILLHNTCNIFNDYAEGRISALIINCFTGFAVPCFYMISGAYLLRKIHTIKETLSRHVLKIAVPTLFWGIIYLLISGEVSIANLGKLFFQQQTPHLWFMYSLFGIYMLLPLISKMYFSISFRSKVYLLGILLIIPTILYDVSRLAGIYIPNPSFAIFWPDLGIFFLGAFLWELREKIQRKNSYVYGIGLIAGLAVSLMDTVIVSSRNGPDKTFISAIGSVGNLLMAVSIFCFVLSLETVLQNELPLKIRNGISTIGKLSMGIYLIHPLILSEINNSVFQWLPLYSNTGSMLQMIFSSIIYLLVSTVVCYCGYKVSIIKKILI